jgi:hypothetical protein
MVNSNARGRREKIKKKVVDDTLSHKTCAPHMKGDALMLPIS